MWFEPAELDPGGPLRRASLAVGKVKVGEVELCYELDDVASDDETGGASPVLLLVSGLGVQLINWDTAFLEALRSHGFRLLRFDNRDVGLSTFFDGFGPANISVPDGAERPAPAYTLIDMADDAARLLDALGIDAVHVLGASMGGMIAQQLAISHPQKVLSLCSIMSMTGSPDVEPPTPEATRVLLERPPAQRDDYILNQIELWKVLGSPGFPFHEDRVRTRAADAFDRSYHPEGTGRQLQAIFSSPDRTEALGHIEVPVLVIHGEEDPLIRLSGGLKTKESVSDARLITIKGMGHDIPPEKFEEFAAAISENTERTARA